MSQKIRDFLSECEVEFVRDDIGEVTFAAPVSDENRKLLSEVRDLFLKAGYYDESISVEKYGRKLELVFKLGDSCWKRGLRVFEKLSDLWESCQRDQSVPDTVFVEDGRILVVPGQEDSLLHKFETYFLWVRLLRRLSEDGVGNDFKYIVASDNSLRRHAFSVFKRFDQIESACVPLESEKTAFDLIDQLDIVDAHNKQREQVMLSTLSSILSDYSGHDPVCWIIEHETSFRRKYYENYEIYTQSFSVDKLLTEVFDKQNEYASKVLENVSSNQAKALALPGALIAAGALIRSGNLFSLALICVGIYVVYVFTMSANAIGREALGNLESQIDRAFRDFIKPDIENEVVTIAGEAKITIRAQITSATERIDMVDSWAFNIFVVGCFFAALNIFSPLQLMAAFDFFILTMFSLVSLVVDKIGEWGSLALQ